MAFDIAAALDFLVHAAEYQGAFELNTKEEYDALVWQDAREKPSWEAVLAVDTTPPETFEALARRVLDESASVQMLAQLLPVLPGMLLMAEAGTEKGTQAALLFLSVLPLPAELEDERQLLLQKLGG